MADTLVLGTSARKGLGVRVSPWVQIKMKKRVIIVHGWDGHPQEAWFPWLESELEKRGFEVQIPSMPNPPKPKIDDWVKHLSKSAKSIDKDTVLVGHSIGCQTILRYLEGLPRDKKVGGAVFVAGWFTLKNLAKEEKAIAKPWLATSIDFVKVKHHTRKFVAIFSDNDDVVPRNNRAMFEHRLGAKTTFEHQKGHFSGSDNIKQLPSALEAVMQIQTDEN